MSYNLSYVSSGQRGPAPGALPAGEAPGPGMPPPYAALPYPPAPGMGPPGQAPPMVVPGQAPPIVMPGQAPPMVMPGQVPPPSINMGPVHNPPVPLITEVPRPLQEGQTIHITGTIPENPRRFHINLTLASGLGESVGIAMHVNPRWDENYPVIVRNTFLLDQGWGQEERWGENFPLQSGQNFECIILVQRDCYKVAFNGQHFCEYNHRYPMEEVTHLVIEEDVALTCVWFQIPAQMGGAMPGVPPVLPAGAENIFKVPYKQEIPGALNAGRMLYISGAPNAPSYDRFVINLGYDIDMKDIALHFNPRYNDKAVVRNTCTSSSGWGQEERDQPEFPFHPGKPFHMMILVEQDEYKVAVNGQHFIRYQHRLRNLSDIKFLEIRGDVTLTNVRV